MMVPVLVRRRCSHADDAAIGECIEVIIHVFFGNMFRDFDAHHEVNGHTVRAGGQIVVSYRHDRSLDVGEQSVDSVTVQAQTIEKGDGVTLTAANIQHGPNPISFDQISPENWRKCRVVSPAEIAA